MALISLNGVSLTFAGPPLLDAVNLQIDDGERLGLLGRNGAGKSTLLKILDGTLAPDCGDVVRQPGLRVASLQQEVPLDLAGTVRGYLHEICGVTASDTAWRIETRIDQAASDLTLDLDATIATLSAGSKRRVLLAAALVRDPDLLILDEPTNHLDLDAIRHLEDALQQRRGTLVFVTHDRSFLRSLATRILDLDRGTIRSYRSGYDAYLGTREQEQRIEGDQAALFDKKLALEEAWVRRGIKARRTRNEGRVRALEALRVERSARRDEVARVKAQVQDAERSGRVVLRCKDVGFAYDGPPIVRGFTGTILRGDRIGILGPNGCGKTTLIHLLLGEIAPQQGSVTAGTKLEVAYSGQLHDALSSATCATSSSTPSRSRGRSCGCPAASASGSSSRGSSRGPATSWSSTSPPTISTSRPSSCSKSCCWSSGARCCWFRTTAPSSTTSSPRPWSSRARGSGASTSAATRTGCARRSPPNPPPPRSRSGPGRSGSRRGQDASPSRRSGNWPICQGGSRASRPRSRTCSTSWPPRASTRHAATRSRPPGCASPRSKPGSTRPTHAGWSWRTSRAARRSE
jgi:ATPase subunit of ABC transporter with duplicated ATPase domains